jgi:serine/threonine-protein kinase
MGLVYMAEQQQPVRRLVALKLIKPGFDSKQTIARFEAERQALAMMDHPNIAKIFDAGTVGQASSLPDNERQAGSLPHCGRPYFVMELVRGIPINEFCDQKRLSVRERLQLFIQVCQAVQHAHQKGIIHRDLKPTNVLVTMADTVAFPKLLDFGIAKALGQSLTDNTLHTGYSQLVGTPLYMSPEQAEMNLFGVDTRSDVYSLGVLLYELLPAPLPLIKTTKASF